MDIFNDNTQQEQKQTEGLESPEDICASLSDQNRLDNEIIKLKSLPGAFVEIFHRKVNQGSSVNETLVLVTLPKIGGGLISCYFVCGAKYPESPPSFSATVNGCESKVHSSTLQNWSGNCLVDVVRDVLAQEPD
ncbi:MAG: hypothetical protein PHW11_08240 [Anaerolineaceae bacterium]|jgi:hypothetical protein|nr:hypothetical protein [Anaerolineaceae bacterium]MDD4043657.1 hypothetical protein [Anaerolineaceae bacterium]MDD4578577.1 hypothetical protein [Anaerolineaceae bacterium]